MTAPGLAATSPAGRDYPLTDADFAAIARLARDAFGLALADGKRTLVYSRLARRLRALGLEDFSAYVALLNGPDWVQERTAFLSALTTNTTHFFREAHHFDLLRTRLLPPLIDRARTGGRVRIWSAGCSTGQEPYSIAMTLRELCPEIGRHDLRILATDIDPRVIATARAANFPVDEVMPLPAELRDRHFRPAGAGGGYRIDPDTAALVTFGVLNLIEPLPFGGPFDIIFCRNVVIYFDAETRDQVWAAFGTVLAAEGALILGHSERLTGRAAAGFQSIGVTAYARHPGSEPSPKQGTMP